MGDGDGGYCRVDYWLGDLIEGEFGILRAVVTRRDEMDDPSIEFTTIWICIMTEFLHLRRFGFR